jgi:hypothetical protein
MPRNPNSMTESLDESNFAKQAPPGLLLHIEYVVLYTVVAWHRVTRNEREAVCLIQTTCRPTWCAP